MSAEFKRLLLRIYPHLSRYFPGRYYPYRFAGGKIYLNIKESQMMFKRAIGLYETDKMDTISAYLKPGMIFVDIGANKGDFTLLAAMRVGPLGRVISFEPEPTNCFWLKRSIAKNGYSNIDLLEIAAGETDGHALLHLSELSGLHSLHPHPALRKGVIKVIQKKLDTVMEEMGIDRVDMIKVDVEGAEIEVLRGACRTLSSNADIILLMDIHPQRGIDPRRVVALLADLGYDISRVRQPHEKISHVENDLDEIMAIHKSSARFCAKPCA